MSLSGALLNSLSGITASARRAEVVASNLSNISTEGYGRRAVELSSNVLGTYGGVNVTGISRHTSAVLVADRRDADASVSYNDTKLGFLNALEGIVGTPDEAGSLANRLAKLQSSLVTASSRPESEDRLSDVLNAAQSVAAGFQQAADELADRRTDAQREIATTVEALNKSLANIEALNVQIANGFRENTPVAALQDLRQVEIDKVAEIVPVREMQRDAGQVALVTEGGMLLLDGRAAEIEFTMAHTVTPHMTYDNGLLSGLTANGRDVDITGNNSRIAGGKLAALFEVRDDLAVDAQAQLDALARNMLERLQDPSVDPSLAPTDAGLFTDDGLAFDPLDEVGLSARLSVNAVADPDQGGALWRLRTGLSAPVEGSLGDSDLLIAMNNALSVGMTPASGNFGTAERSMSDLLGAFSSLIGTDLVSGERELSFSQAQQSRFLELEAGEGVDSDYETQQLLLIEQAYQANARVIQTVEAMLDSLMSI